VVTLPAAKKHMSSSPPKHLKKLRKNWASSSREEIRSAQAAAFRNYLEKTLLPFSKHYRELFAEAGVKASDIQSLDDLAKIPFTSKKDLIVQDNGHNPARDFVIQPDEDVLKKRPSVIFKALTKGKAKVKEEMESEFRPILMTSTTGRSSSPVPFFYSQHDINNLKLSGVRLMEICESKKEYKHLCLFPFAPHLAFWQAHYSGIGFGTFMLCTGGGKTLGTSGNVNMLEKIQPDAIIGMPTFTYHVLRQAREEGIKLTALKSIVLGGEKVPEGMRKKMRQICSELGTGFVDIMPTYAFTECKIAMPICPTPEGEEPSGYHLYPDLSIIEIVDPETGEILPDDTPGEIVCSSLDARGSAVVRYRTGDLIDGGLTYEACPHCGRTCPRLYGKISRVSDIHRLDLGKVKGTLVNFNELEHVLDDMEELAAWQVELRKKDDDPMLPDLLIVHIQEQDGCDRDKIREMVSEKIRQGMEISPNEIHFHDQESIREMQGVGRELKEQKIIDHRPK